MKPITIMLLLILVSCKNETKTAFNTENGIDRSVYEMWSAYTEANPEYKNDSLPDSWYFHDNKEDANRLGELVVNGQKKAASSLYQWYKDANANLPKIGTKQIITDFDGKALGIIATKNVDTIPFHMVSKEYAALDMGTKTEALKQWKKAHWDFFAGAMEESGDKPSEDMLIVCEWFELIWPEK